MKTTIQVTESEKGVDYELANNGEVLTVSRYDRSLGLHGLRILGQAFAGHMRWKEIVPENLEVPKASDHPNATVLHAYVTEELGGRR